MAEFEGKPVPEYDLGNFWQTPDLYDDIVIGGLMLIPVSLLSGLYALVRSELKDSSQQNKQK